MQTHSIGEQKCEKHGNTFIKRIRHAITKHYPIQLLCQDRLKDFFYRGISSISSCLKGTAQLLGFTTPGPYDIYKF
jgi:hypothetical protein